MTTYGIIFYLCLLCQFFESFTADSTTIRNIRYFKTSESECPKYHFRCRDETCLPFTSFCNGIRECDSDEVLCPNSRRCNEGQFVCLDTYYTTTYYCRPIEWLCNGNSQCYNSIDESPSLCSSTYLKTGTALAFEIKAAREKAVKWLLDQRNGKRATYKWGPKAARISVALQLINSYENISDYDSVRDELAYELKERLLTRMALKPFHDISTTELASYVNAFLATCIDPTEFEVTDLVAELRRRKEMSRYSNPYVELVLCNAGDIVTADDVESLRFAFSNSKRSMWTDNRALILMALSCAAKQSNPVIDVTEIQDLSLDIKQKQSSNGTVQNLKTTALVLQALFSIDIAYSPKHIHVFDEEKALKQILLSQKEDGSFGSVVNTYYVLPVLAGLSLVNVTSGHCEKIVRNEEETVLRMMNRASLKWTVGVSIWIGDNRTLERSLTVTVPVNTTAFQLMETAAILDDRFKFQYNVLDHKPYIFSISGIQDDPERGLYWFQHVRTNSNDITELNKSPSDVIPTKEQHVIYWYKHGPWTLEKRVETEIPEGSGGGESSAEFMHTDITNAKYF